MLLGISIVVELIALLMAIALGLYLVTRSARRPEAWLAALTVWAMGGLFLNMLFSLMPPPIPAWMRGLFFFWPKGILEQDPYAWLEGWSATLAPVFWYHATMLMRSGPLQSRRKLAVAIMYALGVTGVIIQSQVPRQYNTIFGDPLYLNALHGSPLYGLFLSILVVICFLCLRNLVLAARAEPRYMPRYQLWMLSAATVLAGLTAPVGLVAAFLNVQVPMSLIALLMGAGVLATVFGVARYSALMENRVFQRDFFYSVISIGIFVAIYFAATWSVGHLYPFPPYVYVMVGVVGVISLSLVDGSRSNADFFFYQQEKRLLHERLRSLESQNETGLLKGLARLLENVCEPIQASYAVLLVHQDGYQSQVAAYHWHHHELELPVSSVAADDLRRLLPGELPEPLSNADLLIPIYLGDQQMGTLIIGPAEHGLAYSPVEVVGLQDFGDYLASWLRTLILQRDVLVELVKPQFPSDPQIFGIPSDMISTRIVELGLRSLHDYPRLAELPLVDHPLVLKRLDDSPSHLEKGEAINSLLLEALGRLRPTGFDDEKTRHGVPPRDWYPYLILRDAYVDCLPNREIMGQLYISEGTFNRTRRAAIRSLTRLLVEMEYDSNP